MTYKPAMLSEYLLGSQFNSVGSYACEPVGKVHLRQNFAFTYVLDQTEIISGYMM